MLTECSNQPKSAMVVANWFYSDYIHGLFVNTHHVFEFHGNLGVFIFLLELLFGVAWFHNIYLQWLKQEFEFILYFLYFKYTYRLAYILQYYKVLKVLQYLLTRRGWGLFFIYFIYQRQLLKFSSIKRIFLTELIRIRIMLKACWWVPKALGWGATC